MCVHAMGGAYPLPPILKKVIKYSGFLDTLFNISRVIFVGPRPPPKKKSKILPSLIEGTCSFENSSLSISFAPMSSNLCRQGHQLVGIDQIFLELVNVRVEPGIFRLDVAAIVVQTAAVIQTAAAVVVQAAAAVVVQAAAAAVVSQAAVR